ncbi:myosin light chain kinase 2, skeletal/cardiac muscle isoform X1 [Tachysurus vachellii]|uniref:myosin light chain kinase 2, skeletal/cardiac muscle isoform X1 n=1 Tax=Tachysurus vachellii TaxID=175792 RepID=UPI00296ACD4C|nr:myosin light chain kinase 2, skeletal/cardiac muscle isoform X1 [Tachysurus vachellii]XP_060750062.1 myosin light chain kinase 2, skeletal/cardiac muscle isoform X1 [Tachysurus vachellii]
MDDLHRKLDQLLAHSFEGSCPTCGMCTHHSRQQEATASQLSAQAKILENLERNVMDLKNALEELTQSLEGSICEKMAVPLAALQRRKSLPVRTSVDEVYVQLDKLRDQKIIQRTFNAPCGKGQEEILIEATEGEGLRDGRSSLRYDRAESKANKDIIKVTPCSTTPLFGNKSPNIAKIGEAKSLSTNSSKTAGVAGCTAAVTAKMDTLTVPSKMHIPPPEVITPPPARRSPPPLEMTMPKPKMSTDPPKMETPSAKMIVPPQKVAPTTKSAPATTQTLKPKITQAPFPFKATVSSPTTTTLQTSLAGSTTIATNQKIPGLWTASVTTSPTSVSSSFPRFNVTENAPPPSSVHSLQKESLGVPVVTSQGKEMSLQKSAQSLVSETLDSNVSQPNSTAPRLIKTKDELLSPKTTGPLLTCLVTSKLNPPPKSPATENITPSHKLPKAPVSTPQNIDKPSTNAQTTKTLTTKSSTVSPVSSSAATSFLQHVYSCPESLQSLQAHGGKAEPATTVTPPFGKSGNGPTGITCTRPQKTGGIQIKISPASEKTTNQNVKIPPKTCFKIIDDVPPQPAPFSHRCVSLKTSPPSDFSIHTREVLGGGRFGKVHKCTEIKNGLRLAAKIISTRCAKEREMVLNEIEVMNQLNHANILQLFDAFETKNQVVLVLEYVEGGELFERIVDESCPLTEVDAMVFVKQICEGVQYMHQMYVLHLDLKPENILCVNRSSHQIKIIDFGLARRYKPREKLRVSFGTPEFLAPEVVNFDFVSFPTDMWTLGVVTYMLLSGLSPFLGDDDSETLNNVLTVNWYFDEETFEHVSAEAKDFVSNLLIKERGGRLSAAQCLKHPWLNNISEKAKGSNIILKSQVLLRKYMARRLWKKNYIAIAAANRFKKIGSSGSLTSLGI